ncbi:hypothetical protein EYC84_002991 [Monilinia fructicola]|uniref:Uncharacterized protein n=1 Tax=Monilinia fructicola TaxID=38448 RepID=A0A5M9JW87_MONFR|nr:hypothetical protein EYC84_002991 [Monilinia fructicola]
MPVDKAIRKASVTVSVLRLRGSRKALSKCCSVVVARMLGIITLIKASGKRGPNRRRKVRILQQKGLTAIGLAIKDSVLSFSLCNKANTAVSRRFSFP